MADFKVPNLCGASAEFNAIQTKFESMITNALDGLEIDASALKATLDSEIDALMGDIKAMIPELPALPDINLQAELTSLSGLDIGTGEYNTLLADLTSKFGSALTTGGFSLDSLVSDAASLLGGGGSLCSGVPNFTVPAAGGDAVQKAVGVKQAAADAEEEKPSVQIENPNVTFLVDQAEKLKTKYFRTSDVTQNLPKEQEGAYVPTTNSRVVTGSAGKVIIESDVTTPKDAVKKENGKTVRANSSKAFSGRIFTFDMLHMPYKFGDKLYASGQLAPGYFPRLLGFVSTKGLTKKNVTLEKPNKLGPGYAQSDIDRGYALKYIFPAGHPASYGLAWTVEGGDKKGKRFSKVTGAEEGKKITDTYILVPAKANPYDNPKGVFGGIRHEIVIVGLANNDSASGGAGITFSGLNPTLYDYGRGDNGDSAREENRHLGLSDNELKITFYLKYKVHSMIDPDSKADE